MPATTRSCGLMTLPLPSVVPRLRSGNRLFAHANLRVPKRSDRSIIERSLLHNHAIHSLTCTTKEHFA
jgi:hypothetical protein